MKTPIIITLHGGCFVGGSETWDKPQTKCLESMGWDVRQLGFPVDEFNETMEYIVNYIKKLDKKVYILGRSSGGYLAKVIHDTYPELIIHALYLAPVFDPKLRASINVKFSNKQKHYFRSTPIYPKTDTYDHKTETLILAKNDENVPKACFTEEQSTFAKCIGCKSHDSVCNTTSSKFKNIVRSFLTK